MICGFNMIYTRTKEYKPSFWSLDLVYFPSTHKRFDPVLTKHTSMEMTSFSLLQKSSLIKSIQSKKPKQLLNVSREKNAKRQKTLQWPNIYFLPAPFSVSWAITLFCAPVKASYCISFSVKCAHSCKEFFPLKKKIWDIQSWALGINHHQNKLMS